MHFLIDVRGECDELAAQIKDLSKKILSGVGPQRKIIEWKASSNLAKEFFSNEKFFVLLDGALRFSINGQLFFLMEEGDWLGLDIQESLEGASFSSDFAIKVEEFSKKDFLRAVLGHPQLSQLWVEYLNLQARLYLSLSGSLVKSSLEPSTSFEQFSKGQTIIKEASTGREVYTMIEGTAEVFVKGTKVGEVKPNQIFGALAAMTNTPRTATVIASSDCTCMSLPEDQFLDLVRTKPETVLQLCRDMAVTIVEINQKVLSLSAQKF